MTTRIVVASTALGLATVCAAAEAGLLPGDGPQVLVVSANAPMPEAARPMREVAGVPDLQRRFTAVHDLNETIEPLHPSGWRPRTADLPVWERYLRLAWGLGEDDVTLLVESLAVEPALALSRIFAESSVEVYADGLMSYGPTRTALPATVGTRVRRLLHLDLVPGLRPVLLREWDVPSAVIPSVAFRSVVEAMGTAPLVPATTGRRTALVLGQYLAAYNLLTESEELGLYAEMARRCAAAGYDRVVFKQHPGAPALQGIRLTSRAAELGVALEVADDPELAEAWFARAGIDLVVGCFSTALLTAATCYDLPAARLGTELLLERLTPFQNSNRVPTLLVDATLPELGVEDPAALPPADDLQGLVEAVAFTMQPLLLADLRGAASRYLEAHPETRTRYVKRRRLTRLGLPGALPPARGRQHVGRSRTLRSVARQVRRRWRRRLGRA